MSDSSGLTYLAEQAGIAVHWNDAHGDAKEVAPDTLITVLGALGLEAHSEVAVARSLDQIHAERHLAALPPLVTAEVSMPIRLQTNRANERLSFRLELENGQVSEGDITVSESGEAVIPGIRATGYHRLQLSDASTTLAVAPSRCYGVADAISAASQGTGMPGRTGAFGVNLQLYSLRRQQPTGIGDFTALEQFCVGAASLGVDAVGINPVHAGFAADPGRFSPYAPSSRLFLNALYVDPAATFGTLATQAVTASLQIDSQLSQLDQASLVDWPGAATVRMQILRGLFARRDALINSQLRAEFDRFVSAGGEALRDHACFEALHQLRFAGSSGWQQWPLAERDPRSPEVQQFALENAAEVEFHAFLQWLAARDLTSVQQHARSAGMSIGIVGDLAVGTDPNGSHAWSRQAEIIKGLVCGAPPDIYNQLGQSWGLTAFSPRGLRQSGYRAFIEMLRATLATAGALRIDHVLGLARLWLVPEHASATHGAYVAYPLTDLLRLVALESWRHHAVIIGENLGTVPAGFNQTLETNGILGTTVLWFERSYERTEIGDQHGHTHQVEVFRSSQSWSGNDMAVTTTHDLPTVAGWWSGHDLEWRERLHLFGPNSSLAKETHERWLDRGALWRALEWAGLASGAMPEPDAAPLDATLQFVAMSPSSLVMYPIEDLLGTVEQPNLPGTFDEHPNWRRRQRRPVAEILGAAAVRERFELIQTRRRGHT
jgi:4-alpha-glucanotransferase